MVAFIGIGFKLNYLEGIPEQASAIINQVAVTHFTKDIRSGKFYIYLNSFR